MAATSRARPDHRVLPQDPTLGEEGARGEERLGRVLKASRGVGAGIHRALGRRPEERLRLGGDAPRGVEAHGFVDRPDADRHHDDADAGEEQGEAGPRTHYFRPAARSGLAQLPATRTARGP